MQKFLGLAELNLIGTDTYRFEDKFAHRYCFQSARVVTRGGEQLLETNRFYVWGESIDTVYKIAVDHMFAPINSVPHDCVDYGEGGGLYDAEIDEQHKEIIIDNYDDWYKLMNAENTFDRNAFYLGD
jgi:hypothetical protein